MSRETILGQRSTDLLRKLPNIGNTARDRFWGGLGVIHNLDSEFGYDELKNFSSGQWLTLGEKQFNNLDNIVRKLQTETSTIIANAENFPDNDANIASMNVDRKSFGRHVQTMKNMVDIYWDEIVKNKLVPPGTTKNFAYACVLLHDFSRFANMNGLPISIADNTSHDMMALAFPGFPQDKYIHDVEYIFGTKELPPEEPKEEGNFFMYFLKLIDTFGKIPRRFVDGFFEKGGLYEAWIQTQIEAGTIPFMVGDKLITAEIYKQNDMEFTMRAYELVKKMIPGIIFDEQINEAAEMTLGR